MIPFIDLGEIILVLTKLIIPRFIKGFCDLHVVLAVTFSYLHELSDLLTGVIDN